MVLYFHPLLLLLLFPLLIAIVILTVFVITISNFCPALGHLCGSRRAALRAWSPCPSRPQRHRQGRISVMTFSPDERPTHHISVDGWARLLAARAHYEAHVSTVYDEALHEVAARIDAVGSLGKADIGALLLWKRLNASTRWAARLCATPDAEVRRVTGVAVSAVRDCSVDTSTAAKRGRSALSGLAGFTMGDAFASALLTAAAPRRMAVYDRRAHAGLALLGVRLGHTKGRYARYMGAIDDLLCDPRAAERGWVARDVDVALFWLGRPAT